MSRGSFRVHIIVHEDGRYFHQVGFGHEWQDVYEFTGEEMPAIDRELANWWTSTNPGSRFRLNLIAGRARRDGTRVTLLNREFTIRQRDGTAAKREIADADELLAILAENFGLHFPAGTRFGAVGSPWPT